MFEYGRRMRLAVHDKGRRAGLKAGAAGAALIAGGFLLAALWTALARNLGWGALGASLAIAAALLVVALILLLAAGRVRHPTPTTDELRAEVAARLNQAAAVAVGTAAARTSELIGKIGNKVSVARDEASWRASSFADRAEKKVRQARQPIDEGRNGGTGEAENDAAPSWPVSDSRLVVAATVLGAFAIGLTMASRLFGAAGDDEDDQQW